MRTKLVVRLRLLESFLSSSLKLDRFSHMTRASPTLCAMASTKPQPISLTTYHISSPTSSRTLSTHYMGHTYAVFFNDQDWLCPGPSIADGNWFQRLKFVSSGVMVALDHSTIWSCSFGGSFINPIGATERVLFCAPKSSDLECRDCRGHTVSACQARTMEMTSPPTTFFFLLRKSSAIALCAFAIYSAQHLINTMSLTARLIRPTARVVSTRGFATAAVRSQKYTLPDLPYGYGELEPAVSGQIMEVSGYCKPQ